ncbi:uncharacterized protein [Periplaneta americana]|uniref:uncharacterized protein isoform X2 n=1 Tax=Periplaneta americana TaxID=6978 RepID=UPI0037E8C5F3
MASCNIFALSACLMIGLTSTNEVGTVNSDPVPGAHIRSSDHSTTYRPPPNDCEPGMNDISCRQPASPCVPTALNNHCQEVTVVEPSKCYPGQRDPQCPLVCVPGSKEPWCTGTPRSKRRVATRTASMDENSPS